MIGLVEKIQNMYLVVLYKVTDELEESLAGVLVVGVFSIVGQEVCVGLVHGVQVIFQVLCLFPGFRQYWKNNLKDTVVGVELLRLREITHIDR